MGSMNEKIVLLVDERGDVNPSARLYDKFSFGVSRQEIATVERPTQSGLGYLARTFDVFHIRIGSSPEVKAGNCTSGGKPSFAQPVFAGRIRIEGGRCRP